MGVGENKSGGPKARSAELKSSDLCTEPVHTLLLSRDKGEPLTHALSHRSPRAREQRTEHPRSYPPDVVLGVCFYLALGGATPVPRSFLSSRDPAQSAQTEGWRDSRIQRPGSQRRGDPEAWESQRPGDRPRGKEARRPTQKHKTCRFPLTPNCPTLKPRTKSMGSIPGDAPDSRHSGPPEQPSTGRLWTRFSRSACSTPAGTWRKAGTPKRAHRNTPPCRTWGTSAWRYLVLHKWLQLEGSRL